MADKDPRKRTKATYKKLGYVPSSKRGMRHKESSPDFKLVDPPKGSSVSQIAKQNGVSVKSILDLNPKLKKDPHFLSRFEKIKVPTTATKKKVFEGTSKKERKKLDRTSPNWLGNEAVTQSDYPKEKKASGGSVRKNYTYGGRVAKYKE
tara:strand:+ start:83 stop:529 length:447 start_codon:yes stop_codon:yes gene_type:complete